MVQIYLHGMPQLHTLAVSWVDSGTAKMVTGGATTLSFVHLYGQCLQVLHKDFGLTRKRCR